MTATEPARAGLTSAEGTVDTAELRTLFLFADLAEEDLRWIAERSGIRVHAPDTVVFAEGQPSDALYVLLEGGLRLS